MTWEEHELWGAETYVNPNSTPFQPNDLSQIPLPKLQLPPIYQLLSRFILLYRG